MKVQIIWIQTLRGGFKYLSQLKMTSRIPSIRQKQN